MKDETNNNVTNSLKFRSTISLNKVLTAEKAQNKAQKPKKGREKYGEKNK